MPFLEAFAFKLVAGLVTRLVLDLGKSATGYGDVDAELMELRASLNRVQSKANVPNLSSMCCDWLDLLTQYCYEAEDIMDSIQLAQIKQNRSTSFNINISNLMPKSSKIKRLKRKLEALESWMGTESSNDANEEQTSVGYSQILWQTPPEFQVMRETDKNAIIDKLICQSSSPGVSIIGMWGIGKTQLAQAILGEERITKQFFPYRPSVSAKEILVDLVKSLKEGLLPEDQQVLILLDGLSEVSRNEWNHFKSQCLGKLKSGSKFLITTRNPNVADVTRTCKYHLPLLSHDDCFKLILKNAKSNGNFNNMDNQAICNCEEKLVRKCNGLPTLANSIGLILSAASEGQRRETVIKICTKSLWQLSELEEDLQNLKQDSLALQPQLKRCFAYCSLFPPSHGFEKENLFYLWMAEGFIEASDLEQTASTYFNNLLSHSFFHLPVVLPDGELTYKMFELIHDLAQNVASKPFRRIHITPPKVDDFSDVRHLSLCCENVMNVEQLLSSIKECKGLKKGLRTFLLLYGSGKKITKQPTFYESLKRLRVLDLSHTNLTVLKISTKLKHLRYLDLSNTPIRILQPLAKQLFALKVLKLKCCQKLCSLPDDLSELTDLICLEVNIKVLGVMPPKIGNLRKLQSLDVFIVENDERYKIAELEYMDHLRKSLCIAKLENVKDNLEAQAAKLHNKKNLEKLELQWSSFAPNKDAEKVLEDLKPPEFLKELTIRNYGGTNFPRWLSATKVCGMLQTVHLDHCEACTVLPSLGQLRLLKTLRIVAMHNLESIEDEFFGEGCTTDQHKRFPDLESLELNELSKLTKWTGLRVGYMPRIRNLQIVECKMLVTLPQMDCLTSLETLEINCCEKVEELPAMPSSLKHLTIADNVTLKERCKVGQADWDKIIGIEVNIDSEIVDTSPPARQEVISHQSSSIQNSEQDPPSQNLVGETQMAPDDQGEFSEEEFCSPVSHYSTDETSQPTIDQDAFSEKQHRSLVHSYPDDESCTYQHEGPSSKQPQLAPSKPVDEILSSQGNQNLIKSGENAPRKPSSRCLSYFVKGCFCCAK